MNFYFDYNQDFTFNYLKNHVLLQKRAKADSSRLRRIGMSVSHSTLEEAYDKAFWDCWTLHCNNSQMTADEHIRYLLRRMKCEYLDVQKCYSRKKRAPVGGFVNIEKVNVKDRNDSADKLIEVWDCLHDVKGFVSEHPKDGKIILALANGDTEQEISLWLWGDESYGPTSRQRVSRVKERFRKLLIRNGYKLK